MKAVSHDKLAINLILMMPTFWHQGHVHKQDSFSLHVHVKPLQKAQCVAQETLNRNTDMRDGEQPYLFLLRAAVFTIRPRGHLVPTENEQNRTLSNLLL